MSNQVRVIITTGRFEGKSGTVVYESRYAVVVLLDSGEEVGFMKDEVQVVSES